MIGIRSSGEKDSLAKFYSDSSEPSYLWGLKLNLQELHNLFHPSLPHIKKRLEETLVSGF